MHLRLIFFFTIGAVLVPPVVFAQEQNAPTLDELVAKNIEAKGGADALRALQSLRCNGKMIVNERSEEHTSELQSHLNLVCRLLLEKKKDIIDTTSISHPAAHVVFCKHSDD